MEKFKMTFIFVSWSNYACFSKKLLQRVTEKKYTSNRLFFLLEKHPIFSLAIKNIHNSTLNIFVLLAFSLKLMKSDKLLYQYWLSLHNAFIQCLVQQNLIFPLTTIFNIIFFFPSSHTLFALQLINPQKWFF